jgi:hypothetical protein
LEDRWLWCRKLRLGRPALVGVPAVDNDVKESAMTPRRLVPLTGIAAVALVVVAFSVGGDTPNADASVSKVVQYYKDNDTQQVTAGILLGLGAFFFLVFASSFRNALRRSERGGAGASTLSFAGAIVFAVGVTIFAGLGVTIGDSPEKLAPTALQALNALNGNMWVTFAVGSLTFLLGSGVGVLTTGALPKWLGWLAIVGVVLAVTPAFFASIFVLGAFILISSVILAMEGEPATGVPPAAGAV